MSNFFPQEFIEQVRSANDIVSLVSEYVSLKKKGRNYFGLCPFHAEKTPSFSVNAEKRIFHCFGCGQSGNVVTFLIVHDKLGFVEAIKLLAKRANIRLPQKEYDKKGLELNDKLYYANQMAASYFAGNLSKTGEGKTALTYLEKRRVSRDTIKEFQLGLAVNEWDGLLKFCTLKRVETETLLTAGLIIERNDGKGFYDRFKKRLMFPIFNLSGKIVAFAGRILDEKDSPKYMNSPETPIYQKGKLLYGLNFSKETIRKKRVAIIVEGYMDFLALWQNGFQNIVASCGTAFTPDQARLLSRFAEQVVLLFDSDSAGQNAVLRSVDLLYDAGLDVKVAILPPGFDPDSYVNKLGEKKLEELISQSVSYVKFKCGMLPDKFGNLNLNEQEQIVKEFALTASKISDGVRRELFLKQAADQLALGEQVIRKALQKLVGGSKSSQQLMTKIQGALDRDAWEKEFFALFLNSPDLFKSMRPELELVEFSSALHSSLWKLMREEYTSKGEFDISALLDRAESPALKKLLLDLLNMEDTIVDREIQLRDYLITFKSRDRKKRLANVKEMLKKAEQENDYEKIKELQVKYSSLLKESQLAPGT